MSDVFISYAREDTDFVHKLDTALRQSQREPWVDWKEIPKGEKWWPEIQAGIEQADTFVFVISPDSVESEPCQNEINTAIKDGKRLMPILRRRVSILDQETQPDQNGGEDGSPGHEARQLALQALREHNWLFFQESDSFEAAFQELLKGIETDVHYVKTHTRLLVKAAGWEDHERKDEYLLRGKDLAEAEQWLAEAKQRKQQLEQSDQS